MAGRVAIEFLPERGLAILRLDQPARRNAISSTMWREIATFAGKVSDDPNVRAVIVRGDRTIFSAGADISDFDNARADISTAADYDELVEQTCRCVEAIAQPTICLIEGACIGAGASLAASCDIRIASENAGFSIPAARLGLGYDFRGIERARRVFGVGAVTQMLFTASPLSVKSAYRLGAVQVLSGEDTIEADAFALADSISANAPLTLRAAKMALRALAVGDDTLRVEALRLSACANASADYREGRAAFAEKRSPRFSGE